MAQDFWGTWNLKMIDDRVFLDLFLTDGSPRDPWVALIPLDAVSTSHLAGLKRLVEQMENNKPMRVLP